MCGICGLVRTGGMPAEDRGVVREMANRLTHRGPDAEGFFFDSTVGLGSRRLRIVDLHGGDQPIGNEDGSIQLVYNGEIYNYRELRRSLRASGHRFATDTDTEVVVHAYEEEGAEALARCNGIFALALWDAPRRRLLLARDPLGVKPLYYTLLPDGIAFASEIKALLSLPGLTPEVDPEGLDLYLAFRFVPPPHTLFRNIRKLAPGEQLVLEGSSSPRRQSYAPAPGPVDRNTSLAEWVEALASGLGDAVRRQLMADVPVGVLLSGGADSAAVLASAASSGARLSAFTVGFRDAPELDEIGEAADTARIFGATHQHTRIGDDAYRERLTDSIFHLDEPVATPSVAPFDALCRLAARDHKVVLSGQGADEPLGGYPRHMAEKISGGVLGRLLAGPVRLASRLRPAQGKLERSARAFGIQEVARRHAEILALFPEAERRRLRRGDGVDPVAVVAERSAPAEHMDPLGRFLYLDARFGLADDLLLYVDKIAMAHSLEVRVPFLDLELLRLVECIPGSIRVGGGRGKSLLRRALAPLLPASVLKRPKRNFSPPARAWLTGNGAGPSLSWLREPGAAVAAYCDPAEIARLTRIHEEGRRDRRRQLFALLAFEVWHRTFIDGRLGHPRPGAGAGAERR